MELKTLQLHGNRRRLPVAGKYVVAVGLLLCTIAIASAGNETDIADIIDMGEVAKSAISSWNTIDDKGGYLIIGLCLLAFLLVVAASIFYGGVKANIGKRSGDNDQYSRGMDGVATAVVRVVAVVIAFVVVGLFLGLL